MYKLLLVDPNEETREAVGFAVKSCGHRLWACPSPEQARPLLQALRFDALLLCDWRSGTGYSLSRRLRGAARGIPTILVTNRPAPQVAQGIAVTIAFGEAFAEQLRRALEQVIQQGELIQYAGVTLDLRQRVLFAGSLQVKLSPLEARLVKILLEAQGNFVPSRTLALAIWPESLEDRRPLYTHMSWLRRKLALFPPARLEAARGLGYRLKLSQPQAGQSELAS